MHANHAHTHTPPRRRVAYSPPHPIHLSSSQSRQNSSTPQGVRYKTQQFKENLYNTRKYSKITIFLSRIAYISASASSLCVFIYYPNPSAKRTSRNTEGKWRTADRVRIKFRTSIQNNTNLDIVLSFSTSMFVRTWTV